MNPSTSKGAAASTVSLDESYAQCIAVTKERAKNFHYAFKVLPAERYKGICALYAFTRTADDLSDDEPDAEKALANSRGWRALFDKALAGDASGHPILPAVADTFKRYKIPPVYMHELITGTEMDAHKKRYEKWDETYLYCYRVASVIGMMTIHVFGFTHERAIDLAEKTGIAFQMTNILRDLVEDSGRDRIYLPLEDLKAQNVSEAELIAGKATPLLRALVKREVERTKEYYVAGRELVPLIVPESRDALGSLVAIYQSLLLEIEKRDYDVFSQRVSLTDAQKASFAVGFAWKAFMKKFGG